MMAQLQRKHVSRLVPADHRVLMPLLLAVTIVNFATLGYDVSVMNGLLISPAYSDYFHLSTATEGLNNAAMDGRNSWNFPHAANSGLPNLAAALRFL